MGRALTRQQAGLLHEQLEDIAARVKALEELPVPEEARAPETVLQLVRGAS
jgi:alpha-D-ribose 1-methylphosphonate 5-triphosphate synthase subunit PhnG